MPKQGDLERDMPRRRELPEAERDPIAEITNLIQDALAGLKACGISIQDAKLIQRNGQWDVGYLVIGGKLYYTIVVNRDKQGEIISFDTFSPLQLKSPPIPGVRKP